jgi:predicted nucleic acid-binding protein
MSAPVFVDTNVFVYSRDSRVKAKQHRASEWIGFLWDTRRGRLSRQVLQEYYTTVTRKLKPGLAPEDAREDVRALFHWLSPLDSAALMESAWNLQDRFSLSFWDALVVGAAQNLGCGYVLSEDLPTGQALDGVEVVNPFERSPLDLEHGPRARSRPPSKS